MLKLAPNNFDDHLRVLLKKSSCVSGNVKFNRTQVKFHGYSHAALFIPRTSAFLAELNVPITFPILDLQISHPKSQQNFSLKTHRNGIANRKVWYPSEVFSFFFYPGAIKSCIFCFPEGRLD